MPQEIERKFLLRLPLTLPKEASNILQGYLPDETLIFLQGDTLVVNPRLMQLNAPAVTLPITAAQKEELKSIIRFGVTPRVLRIRNEADKPSILCVKAKIPCREGVAEVEIETPDLDAMYFMQCCHTRVISKTRFRVPYEGKIWDVDFFKEPFGGLATAEIELAHGSEEFVRPPWAGEEVTNRPEFSNRALAYARKVPDFAKNAG